MSKLIKEFYKAEFELYAEGWKHGKILKDKKISGMIGYYTYYFVTEEEIDKNGISDYAIDEARKYVHKTIGSKIGLLRGKCATVLINPFLSEQKIDSVTNIYYKENGIIVKKCNINEIMENFNSKHIIEVIKSYIN